MRDFLRDIVEYLTAFKLFWYMLFVAVCYSFLAYLASR